jgi:hypothetical protein
MRLVFPELTADDGGENFTSLGIVYYRWGLKYSHSKGRISTGTRIEKF